MFKRRKTWYSWGRVYIRTRFKDWRWGCYRCVAYHWFRLGPVHIKLKEMSYDELDG